MTRLLTVLFLLAATAGAFSPANAQPSQAKSPAKAEAQDPLEIKLERRKVVSVGGKEALDSAAVAKPGDVLVETATYTNKSKGALTKVEATLPVPPNTELVMGSVTPEGAKASLDGAIFGAIPLKRKIKNAKGVEIEQAVALSEYRFLRWYPGELPAGKSLAFSARFKVADK
jgi:uncharacterized repeat protein (TIGR01451 family)